MAPDQVGITPNSQYDIPGRVLTTTSPQTRITTTTLDAAGRPLSTSVSGLTSVVRSYGARGLLRSVVQGPRRLDLDVDALGRVTSVRSPDGLAVTLGYDPADRVTSRTLPGGRSVGYGYDAAGQLTRLTPPGRGAHLFGLPPISWTAQQARECA